MKKLDSVCAVRTKKKPEEWGEIKEKAQAYFNRDISSYVPVFITLHDFRITYDPSFRAWDMVSSWSSYKKLVVVLISEEDEWVQIDETTRISLENSSVLIS